VTRELKEWRPSIESFEQAAVRLAAEAARVVERARAEQERLATAEAAGGGEGARFSASWRLRMLARSMQRAQSVMVTPTDERYTAASEVLRWLDEEDGRDAPWRAEEAA